MLKKDYRLKKKIAFFATYKQNQSIANALVVLHCGKLKTEEQMENAVKIGFVVSKKINKSAVKRNRTKRLLRESCRLILKENAIPKINNFTSLIITARESFEDKNFKEVQISVSDILNKAVEKFC